jgi:hypothetical protein
MSHFKINCTVALLLTVVLSLGIVNDYNKEQNNTTDNQVAQLEIVKADCPPLLLGSYNRQTKVLTICKGLTKEVEQETLTHEMIHYYQDFKDGLNNTTHEVISGKDVVQQIWDDDSLFPELKAHIVNNYSPDNYLPELEAYILENYPLGNVLTYEVSK